MSNVRETSIEAYIAESRVLSSQRVRVYDEIRRSGNATIAEIASSLNMEKSSVSARVNELKGGSIRRPFPAVIRECAGDKRICKVTGHRAISVELIPMKSELPASVLGHDGQYEMAI